MKRLYCLITILLSAGAGAEVRFFEHVRVVTNTELGVLEASNVLVEEGRIVSLDAADAPPGAVRIDGRGQTLTPGLFIAYTQLGLDEIDLEATTIDSKLGEAARGPSFTVHHAFNPASVAVNVNLVEGVTHGVIAPRVGPDLFAGIGAAVDFASGATLAQEVALFADIGANAAALVGGSRAAAFATVRDALIRAKTFRPSRYKPQRDDYTSREMTALASFVGDARPIVVKAHRAREIANLIELKESADLNIVLHGGAEAWQHAAALAAAEIPVILDPLNNLPLSFEQLGARLDNAALLRAAGVRIAIITTDQHNNRLVRQHAGNAVAYGLDWAEAIYAITRGAADIYGLNADLGRLRPGSDSFVLWNGDPLEVTTWPTLIVSGGESVSLESRQTLLLERYKNLDKPPHGYGYK